MSNKMTFKVYVVFNGKSLCGRGNDSDIQTGEIEFTLDGDATKNGMVADSRILPARWTLVKDYTCEQNAAHLARVVAHRLAAHGRQTEWNQMRVSVSNGAGGEAVFYTYDSGGLLDDKEVSETYGLRRIRKADLMLDDTHGAIDEETMANIKMDGDGMNEAELSRYYQAPAGVAVHVDPPKPDKYGGGASSYGGCFDRDDLD